MFFSLLRIRFWSLFSQGSRKGASTRRGILLAALYLYLIGCIGLLFYMLFSAICVPFAEMGLDWFYFTLAGLMGFAFSFVGTIFFSQSQLYEARDNQLLLSMPLRPRTILASRMVFLWLMDFAMNLPIWLTAALVYAQQIGLGGFQCLSLTLLALLLPCFSLALSTLAAWGVAKLTRRLGRFRTLMTMALSVAFLLAYLYCYSQIQAILLLLLQNVQLLAGWAMAVAPFYHLGLAGLGNPGSLLLTAAICLVPLLAVGWLLSRTFLSIALAAGQTGRWKERRGPLRVNSLPRALLGRELRRLGSSAPYMMNAGTGLLLLVVLTGAALLNQASMFTFLSQLPFSGAMAAALAVCFLLSMTLFTASSISLEGRNLWILQSMPVPATAVLAAKLRLHLLLTLPPVILCTPLLCLAFGEESLLWLPATLLPMAAAWFIAVLGLACNLRFPKLDWLNETAAVKQGVSVLLSMLGGMLSVLAAGALGALLLNLRLPTAAVLLVQTAFFLILALPLRLWLFRRGAGRFAAL